MQIIPPESIQSRILVFRDERIILDADLARLYGTTTKRLNEQVKRNQKRFPEGYSFQLTEEEKREVVANCDHLKSLRFSPVCPFAFTEHGALMAATILNTETAIKTSVYIVNAFVQLRGQAGLHKDLAHNLAMLESVVGLHNEKIRSLFGAIRNLMSQRKKPASRIGFQTKTSGR